MRYILVILLFLCSDLMGQRVMCDLPCITHERVVDSIIKVRVKASLVMKEDDKIITLWFNKYFKITASTKVNITAKGTKYLHELIYDKIPQPELVDFIDVMTYDIRGKIYITKYNGIVLRFFANSATPKTNIYTIGWAYRF